MQITNKRVSFGIEAIQSAHRGNPQTAFPVLEDVGYVIVAQAGRIIGVVFVPCKMAGRAIEHAHALMPCTEPEQTGCCIRANGPNLGTSESGWVVCVTPVRVKPAGGPIETAQPYFATYP